MTTESTDLQAVAVGDTLPPLEIAVDRARLVHYAGASGDRNRIHWDERFATGVGLPDVIAHGMFTMGAAIECVSAWCGDPARILEYGTKFVGMVVVPREAGATVQVSGTVKKVDPEAGRATVELAVTSGGAKVLGRALAVVSTAPATEATDAGPAEPADAAAAPADSTPAS